MENLELDAADGKGTQKRNRKRSNAGLPTGENNNQEESHEPPAKNNQRQPPQQQQSMPKAAAPVQIAPMSPEVRQQKLNELQAMFKQSAFDWLPWLNKRLGRGRVQHEIDILYELMSKTTQEVTLKELVGERKYTIRMKLKQFIQTTFFSQSFTWELQLSAVLGDIIDDLSLQKMKGDKINVIRDIAAYIFPCVAVWAVACATQQEREKSAAKVVALLPSFR